MNSRPTSLTVVGPRNRVDAASGQSISVGRSGQVAVDDLRRKVPEIAVLVECGDHHWEVVIPDGVRLWVELQTDGDRVWSGTGSQRYLATADRSKLLIRTTLGTYWLDVSWSGIPAPTIAPSGTTEPAYRVVDANELNDRPWIVACLSRLDGWSGPALSSNEIAGLLSAAPNTIDVRMNRSRSKIELAMDLADWTHDGSRDSIVDWLVASAAVDADLVQTALSIEAPQINARRDGA